MKVLKPLLIIALTSMFNLAIALGVASMISTYYKGLTFIEIVLFVLIMFILIITQSILGFLNEIKNEVKVIHTILYILLTVKDDPNIEINTNINKEDKYK